MWPYGVSMSDAYGRACYDKSDAERHDKCGACFYGDHMPYLQSPMFGRTLNTRRPVRRVVGLEGLPSTGYSVLPFAGAGLLRHAPGL